MTPRRSSKPDRPASLGDVLSSTRRITLENSRAAIDQESWRQAVGTRIADRTEVGALRGNELLVRVASAAWAQELSLLAPEILARLSGLGLEVTRLRFLVKASLAKTPAPVRDKAPRAPARPLPEALRGRLERIEDAELRAAITEAASLALSRPERATSKRPAAPTPPAAEGRSAPTGRSGLLPRSGSGGKRGGAPG